jgi:hypothetical protein
MPALIILWSVAWTSENGVAVGGGPLKSGEALCVLTSSLLFFTGSFMNNL